MLYLQERQNVTKEELTELFLALAWKSGHYPELLLQAVQKSDCYITARDANQKLVGLITAIDDGALNVYIPYLLVHPKHQHQGIGRKMMDALKERYRSYKRIALISYPESAGFYKTNGFTVCDGQVPMELSKFDT